MATGSDLRAAAPFRQSLHLLPDREDELTSGFVSQFLDVSRSSVSLLRMDMRLMKALELYRFSFPYCIEDSRWAATVSDILAQQTLSGPFSAVSVDGCYSIVPSDLFPENQEDLNALLRLEHGNLEDQHVLSATLEHFDAKCVALIPKAIKDVLPRVSLLPQPACWMKSLLRTTGIVQANLHVTDGRFLMTLVKGRELLFFNSFEHSTSEDVLYFTLAALEQLSILHSDAAAMLFGDVKEGDSLHSMLTSYIADVRFGSRNSSITCGYSFKDLPAHALPFLFNLPTCA